MEGQNSKELGSEEEEWESPQPETELGQGADMEMDGQGAGESDMVDWNGFLTGEAVAEAQGDLWPNWDPNEPVTPQQVLRLAGYTQGESTVAITIELTSIKSALHCHWFYIGSICNEMLSRTYYCKVLTTLKVGVFF